MKGLICFLVFFLFADCTSSSLNNDDSVMEGFVNQNEKLTFLQEELVDSLVVEKDAKKVIIEFYDWYINEIYQKSNFQTPKFKKIDSNQYEFDSYNYQLKLNSIKYFSPEFIKNEIEGIEKCNQAMKKFSWDYVPESGFNINECNYLWADRWVGGQGEKINGFEFKKLTYHENKIIGYVDITIDNRKFVESVVELSKVDNQYKINRIYLNWN